MIDVPSNASELLKTDLESVEETAEPKEVTFKEDPKSEESESKPVSKSKRTRNVREVRISLTTRKSQVIKMVSGRATRSRKRPSNIVRRSIAVRRVSIKEKPFKCDIIDCDYSGARKDYLTRHMKVHKQVFVCTLCDKKFMTQQSLTDHESEHDTK